LQVASKKLAGPITKHMEEVMNVYGRDNLAESMRTVRKNTIQIAKDIPEESYGYRPTAESRSVAEILLHIAGVWQITYEIHQLQLLSSLADFNFEEFSNGSWMKQKEQFSKHELLELLQSEGQRLSVWVEKLPESVLAETIQMPQGSQPATKTRFEMLLGAKEHEMHHRGQLMVVQRLLGIVPHLSRNRQVSSDQITKEKAGTVSATAT
jgi:uncharacterized damage-inducible protein DinB